MYFHNDIYFNEKNLTDHIYQKKNEKVKFIEESYNSKFIFTFNYSY
jgi:hypothetical protein